MAIPHSSQRVVAFLALHGRPLARGTVASNLWSDVTCDRAAAALRTALWRLGSSSARRLVSAQGRDLALEDNVDVDFRGTCGRARDIVAGRGGVVSAVDVALLRDAADLLPDWYDDWAIIERERFCELRVEALERICRDLSRVGRYAEATQAGLAAVAAEPLRESAHQALIATHLAEGNHADALRQFELLRDLLRRNLDLAPSPALADSLGFPVR